MSHEITNLDRVGLRGTQAWHGLGVVVDENLSAVDAARRFGLTWPVDQWKLEAIGPNGQRIAINSHVANMRMADQDGNSIEHVLGVVGSDYQVCQNHELAEFADALAQTGKVTVETCGSIRGGKRIWFLCRGQAFEIGSKDKVYPYVLVSNGHDGTQAIRVTPTTVRVICSNTLHMVIPNETEKGNFRLDEAAIMIRHTGKVMDKLARAKEALRYYDKVRADNEEIFQRLAESKATQDKIMRLFAQSYSQFWEVATNEDLKSSDKQIRHIAEMRRDRMDQAAQDFLSRYNREKAELGMNDSMWLAMNAMTGFIQHDRHAIGKDDADRVERRLKSNLFGINAARSRQILVETWATSI